MTRTLQDVEGLSNPDKKVLTDISEEGWHITGVFAKKDEKGPDWAFSIGLFHTFGHPEVIVVGLELETCMDVVSEIGKHIKNGKKYDADIEYDDKCVFRTVDGKFYQDYVGYALWFYEDDPFPIMQCFWPGKDGKFPWDDGCNAYVKEVQPLLFVSK